MVVNGIVMLGLGVFVGAVLMAVGAGPDVVAKANTSLFFGMLAVYRAVAQGTAQSIGNPHAFLVVWTLLNVGCGLLMVSLIPLLVRSFLWTFSGVLVAISEFVAWARNRWFTPQER